MNEEAVIDHVAQWNKVLARKLAQRWNLRPRSAIMENSPAVSPFQPHFSPCYYSNPRTAIRERTIIDSALGLLKYLILFVTFSSFFPRIPSPFGYMGAFQDHWRLAADKLEREREELAARNRELERKYRRALMMVCLRLPQLISSVACRWEEPTKQRLSRDSAADQASLPSSIFPIGVNLCAMDDNNSHFDKWHTQVTHDALYIHIGVWKN